MLLLHWISLEDKDEQFVLKNDIALRLLLKTIDERLSSTVYPMMSSIRAQVKQNKELAESYLANRSEFKAMVEKGHLAAIEIFGATGLNVASHCDSSGNRTKWNRYTLDGVLRNYASVLRGREWWTAPMLPISAPAFGMESEYCLQRVVKQQQHYDHFSLSSGVEKLTLLLEHGAPINYDCPIKGNTLLLQVNCIQFDFDLVFTLHINN